jgi:succinate-acetate transporter protein
MAETIMTIKDATANPAPLGLLGFGMTTIVLNLHNAGIIPLNAMIVGMGLFYGGMAQILAGCMEWKKGNTFGTTAFISYGFFWLSLVAIWLLPKLGLAPTADPLSMSFYLFLWGTLTFTFFIGTFRLNRALQLVFGSLTLLFYLLALGDFTGNKVITTIAGYEGIVCGLFAMYSGVAQVANEVHKKVILPLGPVTL